MSGHQSISRKSASERKLGNCIEPKWPSQIQVILWESAGIEQKVGLQNTNWTTKLYTNNMCSTSTKCNNCWPDKRAETIIRINQLWRKRVSTGENPDLGRFVINTSWTVSQNFQMSWKLILTRDQRILPMVCTKLLYSTKNKIENWKWQNTLEVCRYWDTGCRRDVPWKYIVSMTNFDIQFR